VLQRKADHIEAAQRREGLQSGQRQPGIAQRRLHVEPRRVDALGVHVRTPVEQIVENL